MIGLSRIYNRTQKCVGNGSLSKVCSLGCWVPQGTILGPLIFLIYINDLPNCLSFCQPRMYAGDTHITYASADLHSMQSSLNRDLSNIHKWLSLRTAGAFPVVGGREATTGNASAVRRLQMASLQQTYSEFN